MRDHVMISMPFRQRSEEDLVLLERAIHSVMGQTYEKIILVVTVDGGSDLPSLSSIDGPHPVIVRRTKSNHGRYFADAVTLEAASELGVGYWMVHDADDWAEPDHVENLMSKMRKRTDVVFGGYVRHVIGDEHGQHRVFDEARALRLKHGTHYGATLWRTDSLYDIGGPHPQWRFAWDTMLITISATYLKYAVASSRGYHYVIKENSLTQDRATNMRSTARRRAHSERQRLWARIRRRAREPRQVGEVIAKTIDEKVQAAVTRQAADLVESVQAALKE